MLVFRSFSLIALAFATFSSAVPFDARSDVVVNDLAVVARDNAVSGGVVARANLGVADHYNTCNSAIAVIITQIGWCKKSNSSQADPT